MTKEEDATFSSRLKMYRAGKGYSVTQAAEKFGVVYATWNGWENRNKMPKYSKKTERIMLAIERFERSERKKNRGD